MAPAATAKPARGGAGTADSPSQTPRVYVKVDRVGHFVYIHDRHDPIGRLMEEDFPDFLKENGYVPASELPEVGDEARLLAILALGKWEDEAGQRYSDAWYDLPYPSIDHFVGDIKMVRKAEKANEAYLEMVDKTLGTEYGMAKASHDVAYEALLDNVFGRVPIAGATHQEYHSSVLYYERMLAKDGLSMEERKELELLRDRKLECLLTKINSRKA